MNKLELNEKQLKFIADLVSTGDYAVDYLEATNFAIESWYLGLPEANEDPIYCEFREYFMKKVANVGSGWSNKYKYDDARYSTTLCDYIEAFYNEEVNYKYKNIKAFTYGFLNEYHSQKHDNAKYNGHDWECSFEEYCSDISDMITNSMIEEFSKEEIFNWGFWKHWDSVDDSEKFSKVKKSKNKNKK